MATLVKMAAELTMDASKFVRGLNESKSELGKFRSHADAFSSGVIGVTKKVAMAVAAMALAFGVAAAGIAAYSLNTAVSVESAYAGVIKTTDGLIDETTGRLNEMGEAVKQQFRDMAKESMKPVEELMRIGELGGQLGVEAEGLASFTAVVAGLTQTTMLGAEEGAMALARVANIMGLTEDEYSRVGSVIVDLGNNFATTEPEIVEWGERLAGAGNIAGMSTADIYGIGAAFASVGIQAGEGGTSLQKVFIDMMTASNSLVATVIDNSAQMGKSQVKLAGLYDDLALAELRLSETTDRTKASTVLGYQQKVAKIQAAIESEQAALGQLGESHGKTAEIASAKLALFAKTAGVSAEQFSKMWQDDAGGAFALFVEGLGKSGQNATAILDELEINDARQIRSLLAIAKNADLLTGAIDRANLAWDENSALTEELEKRNRTVAAQFAMLKNTVRDVAISIGDELLPIAADMIKAFREWVEERGPAITAFFNGPFKMALQTIRGIVGYVTSGLKLLFGGDRENAMVMFKMALQEIGRMFGYNVAEMQPFIDKTREVVGNVREFIAAAKTFVTEHAEELKGALIGIAVAAAGLMVFSGIAAAVTALANPIVWIIALAALLGAAWAGNWLGIRDIVQAVIDWLTPYVQTALGAIKAFWDEHGASIIASVVGAWEWIKQTFTDAFTFVSGLVVTALASIKAFWDENGASIIASVVGAWDWIKQAFTDAFNWVTGLVASALNGIALWWKQNGDTVIGVVTWLWDQIKLGFTTAFAIVRGIVLTMLAMIHGDWYEAGYKLRETIDTMWEAIKGLFTGAWIALGNIATWIWDRIKANFAAGITDTESRVTDLIDRVKRFFTETDWGQLGRDIINGVRDGVVGAAVNLYNSVRDAVQGAINFARGFMDARSPSRLTAKMIGEPFAQGIYAGIERTMNLMSRTELPDVMGRLTVEAQQPTALSGASRDTDLRRAPDQYTLNVYTSADSEPIIADFDMLRAMAGA